MKCPNVRPWKLFFNTTIPSRSSCIIALYLSINFNVVSVASVPEFVKDLSVFKEQSTNFFAYSIATGFKNETVNATTS